MIEAMTDQDAEDLDSPDDAGSASTTQWSVVLAAADSQAPGYRDAMAELCARHWRPLYDYIRRHGYSAEEAKDLTQEFFAQLIERKSLGIADPERGRFRAFLLTALRRFLINEWRSRQTQKRGSGHVPVRLDFQSAEQFYLAGAHDEFSPERLYEKQWALSLIEQALARLRREWTAAGKTEMYDRLRGFLTGEGETERYRQVADALGLSEAAVKMAVHRLRKRCAQLVREEVAQIVADPADVDAEVRDLVAALSDG